MRIILSTIILFLLYNSCKKPDFNDLGGSSTISGIAVLNDNYSNNNIYTPVKQLTVYLRNRTDTLSYLYTTKTNDQGQFSFNNIDNEVDYLIDAVYDVETTHYSGKMNIGPNKPAKTSGKDTLLLKVDPELQNGIHLTVKDESGGAIPNAIIWVFSSPALFAADTSSGAIFNMTCNAYGISNKYSVSAGDYYFRVKTYSGNTILVDEQKATVGNKGIQTVELIVRTTPRPGFGNGIDMLVKDKDDNPVSNATIFFYKNYESYILDSAKNQTSNFKLISGADGHAKSYIVNPAEYFIWARKITGPKDTLSSRSQQSIIVTNTVTNKPITIQ